MKKLHHFYTGLFFICSAIPLLADVGHRPTLVEAAERGDLNAVKSLLQESDVNSAQGDGMTALHWAAYREDLKIASALVQAGANVNAANRLNAITPLLIASNTGNAAIIELLLRAGADANLANSHGTTPLMLAAASGKADAVKTLLDHGANVNARELFTGKQLSCLRPRSIAMQSCGCWRPVGRS